MKDRIFEEKRGLLGKIFSNNLYILFKTALIHDINNIAFIAPLERTMESIENLLDMTNSFSLRLIQEYLFIDDIKIKVDIENFMASMFLIEEMKIRGIGSLTFNSEISLPELKRFIYAFINTNHESTDPFEDLKSKLSSQSVNNITIDRIKEEKEFFDHFIEDTREMAKNIYFKTLSVASEVMDSVKLKNTISIKKAKRLVQSMVDLMLEEESTLLGLTTLRAYDEYTYNHSVNVSILSIAMGQRLGYQRRDLGELGMATLFHDIGKIELPVDILNKPTEFTPEEWQIIRRHPVHGVKTLLKLKGLQEQAIRMVMASFEHHLNYDLSGYPKLAKQRRVSLYGRIASIADCYDALTSSRVYNRNPFIPDKALSFMMKKSNTAFDPILLKIFINVVGIYPVGTLVLLNTRQLGVVTKAHPNPVNIYRPRIKIITDPHGNEIDGDNIDLSEYNSMSIARSLDHRKYGIEVSKYFL